MSLNDFILDSDYPIDKIVGSVAGSFSRNTSTYFTPEVVAHGLPFAPTYIMQWSTNADFIPAYSEQLSGDGNSPLLEAQASPTTISLFPYVPAGTISFYYRVILFMPPDIDVLANETASSFDNFILNTDYNYPKIFQEGRINGTTTINHNLGYVPLVDFWIHRTSDNILRHFPVSETDAGNLGGAIATETSVTFYLPSGHDYMYYKIYGDEA